MSPQIGDIWYRYDAVAASATDASVYLSEYKVERVTPQGVWINYSSNGKGKFINSSWRKKFAYPSKEEAIDSFIRRKKAEIGILEARLATAKAGLKRAESGELRHSSCLFDEFFVYAQK